MKINSKLFNFSFFLSHKTPVQSLESGAMLHGGATKNLDTDELYSNIPGNNFIEVSPVRNTISLFIPDTINVSEKASQELKGRIVWHCAQKIQAQYHQKPFIENAIGSWYSDDLNQVVCENIILLNVHLDRLTITDVNFFISLASYIKKQMRQEGVSIAFNDALAIV